MRPNPLKLRRHIPFQFNSQPRKPSCPRNQRSPGESAATLWTRSVTTTAPPHGHLCFSSVGSVNDSCPQDMSCGRNCRNKFQTQPAFRKPTATGEFSSHPSRKKLRLKLLRQDKMLSIPKYCRNANQNGDKKSSPISPIRASSGGYKHKAGEPEERERPYTVGGKAH